MSLLAPFSLLRPHATAPQCPRCGEADPDLMVIIRHEYQDNLGRSVIWASCRTCRATSLPRSDFAVGVATPEDCAELSR